MKRYGFIIAKEHWIQLINDSKEKFCPESSTSCNQLILPQNHIPP